MNLILSLILVTTLLPHTSSISVRVIFVSTNVATSTNNDEYLNQVHQAFAFWQQYKPFTYAIVDTETIYVADPFNSNVWLQDLATYDNSTLELYVIANVNELLFQEYVGLSAPNYNLVLLVQNSKVGFAPALAHELGHVLFDLPDLYLSPGKCNKPDIMCYAPNLAYYRNFPGCVTLEYLGKPCAYVNLPVIQIGVLTN